MKPSRSPCTERKAAKIKRLERRVVNAAMRLADYGHGFVFTDTGKVENVDLAKRLENACGDLRDAMRPNSHRNQGGSQ